MIYSTLLWIHIVAAGLVLGLLAVFPFLPVDPPRGPAERAVLRHSLAFLNLSSNALLVPSIVVLFITGVLMSVGPFSEWDLVSEEGQWIVVGMFLWTLVAAIVAGLMFGVVKEMLSLAEDDEVQASRMDRLRRQFRWGYVMGVIVTLATFWVMVFQPVFF